MLKKIVLHTAAADNVGGFHDAGSELDVGDAAKAGVITHAAAQDLIDRAGAVSKTEAERPAKKAPAKKAAAKKPAAKKPAPTPTPTPTLAPTPVPADSGEGQA